MRRKEFERLVGRSPSKPEVREMRRRLRRLYCVAGRFIASLPHTGPGGEIAMDLPKEVRALVQSHDACDWFAVEEDTAPEDGA